MDSFPVYKDMKARTGGELYIGVVGPVRSGKSTFIKRFMEQMVLPQMEEGPAREQARDELPQSAQGKMVMTTEPKFIPKEAANITLGEDLQVQVRLIDCVGYMVEGATGHMEENGERLVKTPWFDYEIPFTRAAEIGTEKVIREMILPIYIYGQPVLRKVAQDITADYPELDKLIADMWDTLAESEGIGLAAPQIGKDIRLVVIDLDVISDDLPEYKGFRNVFINAHIVEYDESKTDTSEEGCLSLPGIHERVTRPTRIHVQWLDEKMQPHDEWVEGYLARVMQHEFDHLEGKVFVDRISPLRKQLIKSKMRALLQGRVRCGYKTKMAVRK